MLKVDSPALEDSMAALHVGKNKHAEQSEALNSLVRALSSSDNSAVSFPSLDSCGAAFVRSEAQRLQKAQHTSPPGAHSRSSKRPPAPRDSSVSCGSDVSPAFRHFVHQVLSQTLLSPTTLMVALYYVRGLPAVLAAPGEAGGDEAGALALFAHPHSSAPFKLLTLGLMLANKHLDDNTFLNKTWQEVTGVQLIELNRMEAFYLCRGQYKLSVPTSRYRQHLHAVRAEHTGAGTESTMTLVDREHLIKTLDQLLAAVPDPCHKEGGASGAGAGNLLSDPRSATQCAA